MRFSLAELGELVRIAVEALGRYRLRTALSVLGVVLGVAAVMCAVIAIGVPIVRAFTRRMYRRTVAAPTADAETRDRLERIEQAVDAIAVEVERISEGQRFTTKIISELRGLPQPDPSAALAERAGDRSAVPLSRTREAR